MAPGVLPPLAVTMGDPAGIGPEIALAAWLRRDVEHLAPFAILGDAQMLSARAGLLGLEIPIARIGRFEEAATTFARSVPVLDVPLATPAAPGRPDAANGPAVIAAIERAVAATHAGEAAAVVTNPIAKSVLYAAGFRHPGHTEFLADLALRHWPDEPAEPVMMIASDLLRVVPLTIHIALARVPGAISTASIVKTARIMAAALDRDFGIAQPRIAIAGLNPHAGEDGSMGLEDRDIVAPAVAELRAEGLAITGPHPADTLFHAARRATYDAVLCMYHDQALIPVKTLAFDTGVNVTLGLPFVRTSPDHGTAFDIAGRGVASPSSLIAALRLAASMAERRCGRSRVARS
ncbi:MAG: 4-hydroxythreonine-4-phosphate dehydrogenase PdxA [Hyphomicrobiaceae bacterium]|nr:4-hydroxythreonine-4-phosphate dehydrogenase PdxA [Hyphomicrobiaceae bacterium]